MTNVFILRFTALAVCLIAVSGAKADGDAAAAVEKPSEGISTWLSDFKIEPQLMQSKDSSQSASLGLTYKATSKPIVDQVETWGLMSLSASAEGAYASRKEDNPDNLINAKFEGEALVDVTLSPRIFATAAYIANQGSAQKALTIGSSASVKMDLPRAISGFIIPRLGLDRVHPTKDDPRVKVLGKADDFTRWNASVLAVLRIGIGGVDRFETNYYYFKETSAPSALVVAGQDRFRLATYYIRLKGGAFVAYTSGSLPADRKATPTFKAGWSSSLGQ
jgi:hypothetical protein